MVYFSMVLLYVDSPCFYHSVDNLDQMYDVGVYVHDLALHDLSRDLVLYSLNQSEDLNTVLDRVGLICLRFNCCLNYCIDVTTVALAVTTVAFDVTTVVLDVTTVALAVSTIVLMSQLSHLLSQLSHLLSQLLYFLALLIWLDKKYANK